jgi:hypothetical protein
VFARVSSYEIPPERAGDATLSFQQAIGQIRAMNGLAAAYLLVNVHLRRRARLSLRGGAEASRELGGDDRLRRLRTLD